MPSRQKMQDSVRPSTVNKAVAKAPADAKAKKMAAPAAVAKPITAKKAVKPKAAKPAAPVDGSEVAKPAKPAKVSEAAKPAKASKSADTDKAIKPAKEARQKHKLVRDSFTLPREDFELIHVLKERALGFQRPTRKSELLRAGLQALAKQDAAELQRSLEALITLSPGRPKKHR